MNEMEEKIVQEISLDKNFNEEDDKGFCTSQFWIARNFNLKQRRPIHWMVKRSFDIISSILGLLILAPIMIITAIAIKLESKGPIIYKNKRTGIWGKEFYLYKFRSMREDAERLEDSVRAQFNEADNVMYKMDNDPRITNVGKFIRKYSLDELPQLFNVIKGDMSVVGPRPRASKDLILYKNWHFVFFATLPGITGMWGANGRSSIKDFDTVVKMEYDYITNWNVWLDFHLIFKTIPAVLIGKNAG